MKNIDGIIKSILLSDRPINHKNIKFDVLKEILISNKLNEIINIRNSEMKDLVNYYKKEIDDNKSLKPSAYYVDLVNSIQQERLKKVMSGNVNTVVQNRLKDMYRDEEIEEIIRDRGEQNFRIKNDTIMIKRTTMEELNYHITMMKTDVIHNIITSYEFISHDKFPIWYEKLMEYAKITYGTKLIKDVSKVFVGDNKFQREEYIFYYCLTNDKICVIKRLQLKL